MFVVLIITVECSLKIDIENCAKKFVSKGMAQCDQIRQFLKVLVINFLAKVAQKLGDF